MTSKLSFSHAAMLSKEPLINETDIMGVFVTILAVFFP